MVRLRKFSIWAEIKCNDFEAETEDEVKELFWESISDRYGIASATTLHEIKEVR